MHCQGEDGQEQEHQKGDCDDHHHDHDDRDDHDDESTLGLHSLLRPCSCLPLLTLCMTSIWKQNTALKSKQRTSRDQNIVTAIQFPKIKVLADERLLKEEKIERIKISHICPTSHICVDQLENRCCYSGPIPSICANRVGIGIYSCRQV